jgi:uncharacterized repeat protein (TIGR04076 family)
VLCLIDLPYFDVKITVLKKTQTHEIFDEYADPGFKPICNVVQDGKEYISHREMMPEGFCPWAWADIQRDVVHLALGGEVPWSKQKHISIVSCTDGLRPVIFKLERLNTFA